MSDDNVTNIMPDNPELIALSQEAKDFKSSGFGTYLLDRAAQKAGNAAKALCDVDPTDIKKIIKYQADAKVLGLLNEFINEAINIGNQEYAEYQRKIIEGDENV